MTVSAFESRIREALRIDDPRYSADTIKSAVIDELRAMDENANIVTTNYFNHSYFPDLVVKWRRDGKSAERLVFLRSQSDANYLLDDVNLLKDSRPILFGLDSYEGSDDAAMRLDRESRSSDTLVTDAAALAMFRQETSVSSFSRLASSALVQGGRGLLASEGASTASATLESGLTGALSAARGPTREAINASLQLFDQKRSHRLIKLLWAVWIGSGGRSDLFPGAVDPSA